VGLDRRLVEAIKLSLAGLSADQLRELQDRHDTTRYSDEAFAAARELLAERAAGRPAAPPRARPRILLRPAARGSFQHLAGRALAGFGFVLMFAGGILLVGPFITKSGPPTDDGKALGACLGAVVGIAGTVANLLGRRLAAVGAGEAERADPRPPVLLLRSFADDNIPWFDTRRPAGSPVPAVFYEQLTFEEMVAEECAAAGPVAAIGRPGERLPTLGAARTYVSDGEQWTDRVGEYLGRCGWVVMVVGRTDGTNGLAWELRQIIARVPLEKVVFVVPPVDEAEAAVRWAGFRAVAGDLLPPYRGGELVAGFRPPLGWVVHREQDWHRTRLQEEYRRALRDLVRPAPAPSPPPAAAERTYFPEHHHVAGERSWVVAERPGGRSLGLFAESEIRRRVAAGLFHPSYVCLSPAATGDLSHQWQPLGAVLGVAAGEDRPRPPGPPDTPGR
jgi:hypothetical protein